MRRTAVIGGLALVAATFLGLLSQAGCAAGRTPSGGIVLGAEVGKLVESGNEAISAIADSVGGLVGLGAGVLGPLGIAAVGWARSHARATASEAARKAETHGWNEAAATYSAPPPRALVGPELVADPGGAGQPQPTGAGVPAVGAAPAPQAAVTGAV